MDRAGDQLGIDRQRHDVANFVSSRGWTVVGEFVDNDVSATNRKPRPQFDEMMKLVDDGRVDAIVARHMDRLLRRLIDLEAVLERCEAHGVRIVTTGENIDTGTDGGRMYARVLGTFAQGEMERKSARQRSAASQAAKEGRWTGGRRAFGYEPDGVTIRESEACLVRKGYADLLAGVSCGGIARSWNGTGISTPQGKRNGSPGLWTHANVRDVLTNPRYAGLRRYRPNAVRSEVRQNPELGIQGKAEWDALVAEEVWWAAIRRLTDSSRWNPVKGGTRLLTGIAQCGVCANTVHAGASSHRQPGYRCKSNAHFSRRSGPIDDYVERLVLGRLSRPDALADLTPPADREVVGPLVTELEAVRLRIGETPTQFADGLLDALQLRQIMTRLQERAADLETRIAQAGQLDVIGPLITSDDIESAWYAVGHERKRAVIKLLFEAIEIHPVGAGVRTLRPESITVVWRTGT
jgi:site-specific DNA recombinase